MFFFALILPTAIPSILPPRSRPQLGNRIWDLPWITVWQYLSEHLKDDEGTPPGAKPSNRSNRFEVADRINALLYPDAKKTGPFWCLKAQLLPIHPAKATAGAVPNCARLRCERTALDR